MKNSFIKIGNQNDEEYMKKLKIFILLLIIFSNCKEKDEKFELIDLVLKNPERIVKIFNDSNFTTNTFREHIEKYDNFSIGFKDYIEKYFSSGYNIDFESFNKFDKNSEFYGKKYGIEITSKIDSTEKIQINLIKQNGNWMIDWILTGDLSPFPLGS